MDQFEHEEQNGPPAGGGGPAGPGGDANRRRGRRGRRGRGGTGGPGAPRFAPQGPRPEGGPEDEGSSQTREIAAYERRQQQPRGRGGFRPGGASAFRPGGATAFRPASPGFRPAGGEGFRPAGQGFRPAGAQPFRAGGWRGGARRPGYQEEIRRVTGGPRGVAAPSHDAGEPIAGPHAVLEAIRAGRVVKRLYVSEDRSLRTGAVNELIAEAQEKHIFIRFTDKMEIDRLSPIESHQGVVAVVEGRAGVELDELLLHLDTVSHPALALVVDSLQDPQNFGVLLRSAEGAGVDGVVIPRHRAVGITPAVAKTSAGASEHLLIADVANLRQAIDAFKEKGLWVVAADESGDLLYDEVDYRGPTALVIGGEGEGIRRLVLEGCDQVVRIPMAGQVSSLNAAAAGTVLLYEAVRQRTRDAAPAPTRTPRPQPAPDEQVPADAELEDAAEEDLGEEQGQEEQGQEEQGE